MFRQDYRINKITYCGNKIVIQGEKHPLLISLLFFPLKLNCVFAASSGSREKIKSIQLILSENILALCLNIYELISKTDIVPAVS